MLRLCQSFQFREMSHEQLQCKEYLNCPEKREMIHQMLLMLTHHILGDSCPEQGKICELLLSFTCKPLPGIYSWFFKVCSSSLVL